jgi:hypothetical protein
VWEAAILPLSAVPEVGAEREVTVLPVSAYLGVGTEQFPAKATFIVDFFKFKQMDILGFYFILFNTASSAAPQILQCGCWDQTKECWELAVRPFNQSARYNPETRLDLINFFKFYPFLFGLLCFAFTQSVGKNV